MPARINLTETRERRLEHTNKQTHFEKFSYLKHLCSLETKKKEDNRRNIELLTTRLETVKANIYEFSRDPHAKGFHGLSKDEIREKCDIIYILAKNFKREETSHEQLYRKKLALSVQSLESFQKDLACYIQRSKEEGEQRDPEEIATAKIGLATRIPMTKKDLISFEVSLQQAQLAHQRKQKRQAAGQS